MDGDFSEENRNRCRVATAPLIEAVENLTTFASNPEFASVPAQISSEVRLLPSSVTVGLHSAPQLVFSFLQGTAAQEPILQSACSMLDSSTHLLKTARSLVINPKDPPTWSVLAGHSRTVSDSIKGLITAIRLVGRTHSNQAAAGFFVCFIVFLAENYVRKLRNALLSSWFNQETLRIVELFTAA